MELKEAEKKIVSLLTRELTNQSRVIEELSVKKVWQIAINVQIPASNSGKQLKTEPLTITLHYLGQKYQRLR